MHVLIIIKISTVLTMVHNTQNYQTWSLTLCKRPNRVGTSFLSPENRNWSGFRNVFPSYFEFRMTNESIKPVNLILIACFILFKQAVKKAFLFILWHSIWALMFRKKTEGLPVKIQKMKIVLPAWCSQNIKQDYSVYSNCRTRKRKKMKTWAGGNDDDGDNYNNNQTSRSSGS
jgi:hypothetical protein